MLVLMFIDHKSHLTYKNVKELGGVNTIEIGTAESVYTVKSI